MTLDGTLHDDPRPRPNGLDPHPQDNRPGAAKPGRTRKARTGSNRGRGIVANGRSKRQGESFLAIGHRLIDAPAFKALSPAARTVLILVMGRYRGDPAENGNLPFAARDAAPWGLGRTAASEALSELVALRFLSCTRPAAMLGRLARRWACSELSTMDGRGRTVAATYAARRLSQAEVDTIVAELAAARKAARQTRDPASLARLTQRNIRPHTRTQVSGHADTNSSEPPEPGLVSAHADANDPSEGPLCPHTRTASISTRVSAQRDRQRSSTELADGPASLAQKCDRTAVASTPPFPAAEPARSPIPSTAEDRGRRGEADDDRDPAFETRRADYIRALGGDPGQPSGLLGGVQRAIRADHEARIRQPVTPDRLDDLIARLPPISASSSSAIRCAVRLTCGRSVVGVASAP